MSLIVETAFRNILGKIDRLRHHQGAQRKLIVTAAAYPAETVLELAKMLDSFAVADGKIALTFKVAKVLGEQWQVAGVQVLQEIAKRGWLDETGNLTGYRNAPPPRDGKLALVILVGADLVQDSSSLADFYRCDTETLWTEEMKESFLGWSEQRLNAAQVCFEKPDLDFFNSVLKVLYQHGRANLFQISTLLESLPLEKNGVSDGEEARRTLLTSLRSLGLPSFTGLLDSKHRKRGLAPYLEPAVRFFRYDLFLEESKKKSALKAINSLLSEKEDELKNNSLFVNSERKRGHFATEEEFVLAVKEYVENEKAELRQKLFDSDFVTIYDEILKFKPEVTSPTTERVRKITGGPIDGVLTALWLTIGEFRKGWEGEAPGIESLSIEGESFRYDSEGFSDISGASPADKQELARSYLERFLGGVDRFFKEHLDEGAYGNANTVIRSSLLNEEVSFSEARTAEPSFAFLVRLGFSEGKTFTRHFALRLPETHSFRMAQELIEWACQGIRSSKEFGVGILPVFHVPYYEELIRAKDDEETRRVLLHSVRDIDAASTNLITKAWGQSHDPLLSHLRKLAAAYRDWLEKANGNGLFSTFHKAEVNSTSPWETLLKSYKAASKAFHEDEDCKNSPMGAMLMRAFLILETRGGESDDWVVDPFEASGVVTILHPSMAEMLLDQTVFLFACFNHSVSLEWKKKKGAFAFSRWQDYLDLAAIEMPVSGLIGDENKVLNTRHQGKDLIHKIVPSREEMALREAPLSTRLLLRYEGFEEEDIADYDLFEETRESRLLQMILDYYLDIHPHARDGINLALYWNKDIQPVISGVHAFLNEHGSEDPPLIGEGRARPYSVTITLFSEAGEDNGVERWLEEWKERWEAAETEEKYRMYRYCRFSVLHRVVPSRDPDRKLFARMIHESLDADIVLFYDFIGAGSKGNDFLGIPSFDLRKMRLKFPIMEKAFCMVNSPERLFRRDRIISNPQFEVSSLHLETMVRLMLMGKGNPSAGERHVLVGKGDFKPWQDLVDEAHKKAEWVVCVDPSVDDELLKTTKDPKDKKREIVGFGSGVGLHGELNYTISTEHFGLCDIKYRLSRSIQELFLGFKEDELTQVTESVIREGQNLSGVSLVRATGVGNYIHDFMAYTLAKKILEAENDENLLCRNLITLDAYNHWFPVDSRRPDLLWLTASVNQDGLICLKIRLIECKLAGENELHVEKAVEQVKSGLRNLIPAFRPREAQVGGEERPDQRYWWLQLHRLLASKTRIDPHKQQNLMSAMEKLAEGEYEISWGGAVLAFWTDRETEGLECVSEASFMEIPETPVSFRVYSAGPKAIYRLCSDLEVPSIPWKEEALPPIQVERVKEQETDREVGAIFKERLDEKVEEKPEEKPEERPEGSLDVIPEEKPKVVVTPPKKETTPVEAEPKKIPERILLGTSLPGDRRVYWEFGHPKLNNRHLLVFGSSGMGKTYAIQCLLCELGLKGQNSLVMDYTNGFTQKQLEQGTKKILIPHQHYVSEKPLPISPFKLQTLEVDEGRVMLETRLTAAKRIAGTFQQVYETLGDQQYSCLIDAINSLLERKGEKATLEGLQQELEGFLDDGIHQKGIVSTTLSKIKPFIMGKPFPTQGEGLDWDGIFSDGQHRCHVFQFAGIDPVSARLTIEFTLWDLNSFVRGMGNKNLPKVIVLDEAQNLDLSEHSPVSKYLTEGRKFGLSLILATQTMKNLKGDKLSRLFQAAHKLFFRPADTELQDHGKLLSQTVGDSQSDWVNRLSGLAKGECYSVGPSLNQTTGTFEVKSYKIRVTSLEERFEVGQQG